MGWGSVGVVCGVSLLLGRVSGLGGPGDFGVRRALSSVSGLLSDVGEDLR